MSPATARIAALYYYPVKSGRGLELEEAPLTAAGLEHDRRWMVVNPAGRFLTQRELPRLALLRPSLTADGLCLGAAGLQTLRVPLAQHGARRRVRIWKDQCAALDEGDAAADWLTRWLGTESRLVRFDPIERRLSSSHWTGRNEAENRFSDGFPLLVLSTASLEDLNSRLKVKLPVARFRPNLLLDGLDPYDEDRITELRAEGIRLGIVKPCARCKITTTNQDTGEVEGNEPLATLKTYRYDPTLKGVLFAQNAIVIDGVGRTLRRGQSLEVHWKGSSKSR
jgi:MOSC domain-containing protein